MPFAPVRMPEVKYDLIPLRGGLDQTTPTLFLAPGMVTDAVNFEVAVSGGYARISGYERFDGQAAPSDALALTIDIATFTNVPSVGDVIDGVTSGASATIAYVGADYVTVTKLSGTFQEGEALEVSALPIGTADVIGSSKGARQDAILLAAAADAYRADITEVPGSGAVRGVVYYNDVLYAFRDNAGGTATDLYKSTSSGWTQVAFYNQVSFTAGAGDIDDAQTITQGANSATIKRVVIETSDLDAGNATGRLIISAPSPGSFTSGAATTSGGGTLTLSGAETAITRAAGGRYEMAIANFRGQVSSRRVYGADGVDYGFEFDGDVLVPIHTGTATDTPTHVAEFKKHLFFGFNGSAIHSGLGEPYKFQAIDGASEIAVGDDITGLVVMRGEQQGGALAIFARNSTNVLYGTSAADWDLVPYGEGSGCLRYSAQYLTEPYVLDDRGVVTLKTTQSYGNFDQATLTANLQTFINTKRTLISASVVDRTKSQYRLFFSDGSGLFMTILNGKFLGAMPMEFPAAATCAFAGETAAGVEVSFFGGDDGVVYQLEKGTSFDGEQISASFTLAYNSIKSPRILKHFRHLSIEMQGGGYAAIGLGYTLGYGVSTIPQPGTANYATAFTLTQWDSMVWDSFIFDGVTLAPTEAELRGTAENISVTLASSGNYVSPFTVNSLIFHYTPRRGLR